MEPIDDVGGGQEEGRIGVKRINVEPPVKPHAFLRLALLLVPASLLFSSCEESSTEPAPFSGNYEYTAFDSSGVPVVRGALHMARKDSATITGSWSLEPVDSAQNIGPQVGRGTLEGWMAPDTTVHLNLNPGWVDNNVFLEGKLRGDFIRGTWTWSTIVGETNAGTFVAKKILLAL